jgi:hypothetical protein
MGKRRARRRARQIELPLRTWGGKRKGAGRKPSGPRRRVSHVQRPAVKRDHPVHVTMRIVDGVPSLRDHGPHRVIVRALVDARGRFGLCVVDYSILGNHLHLIVEHDGVSSLSRGMRGLATRLAKRLNKHLRRRGRVFADRYHARALTTPREVHHALSYVLLNYRRHAAQAGRRCDRGWIDPCSSGRAFDGWRTRKRHRAHDPATMPARTWLRREGWRQHGLVDIDDNAAVGPP